MSHNVRLDNIKFKDLDVLKAAVDELRAEGANIELVQGKGLTARVASPGVRGYETARDVTCDVMLRCPDNKWDVAFALNADGEYVPETEHLFRQQGVSAEGSPLPQCAYNPDAAVLGGLSQRYAVIQTEINAARAGYATKRTVDARTKQMQLEVNV